MIRIPFFETFERRGEKSIMLGAYILKRILRKAGEIIRLPSEFSKRFFRDCEVEKRLNTAVSRQ